MKLQTLTTKTFWTGVAAVATGIGLIYAGDQASGIQTIIMGLLAIAGRDALSKTSSNGGQQ